MQKPWPCSANCDGNAINTTLIDISASGARLAYANGFKLGGAVKLNIPNIGSVDGTVAHMQNGQFIGLSLNFSATQQGIIADLVNGLKTSHVAA